MWSTDWKLLTIVCLLTVWVFREWTLQNRHIKLAEAYQNNQVSHANQFESLNWQMQQMQKDCEEEKSGIKEKSTADQNACQERHNELAEAFKSNQVNCANQFDSLNQQMQQQLKDCEAEKSGIKDKSTSDYTALQDRHNELAESCHSNQVSCANQFEGLNWQIKQ